MESQPSAYDVAIIGVGVAGLAAAAVLGRSGRSVVMFGMPERGNDGAVEVHNLPYAEGVAPEELYRSMERELLKYDIPIFNELVDTVTLNDGAWPVGVRTARRAVVTSRILIANGVEYLVPAWVPKGTWGTTVFDCPFCHAYEHRGDDFVVVGPRQMTLDLALICWAQARSMTVLVADESAADSATAERIRSLGGQVLHDTVRSARSGAVGGLELSTEAGRQLAAGAVVLTGITRMRRTFVDQLSLAANRFGVPETEADGRTSNPLVWVAGNAANPQYVLVEAMGSGIRSAIGMHKDLALQGPA